MKNRSFHYKKNLLLRSSFKRELTTLSILLWNFKTFYREDKNIKLRIWDTAGQECYQAITSVYYPSAMGFIVMFDLSDEESFSATKKW